MKRCRDERKYLADGMIAALELRLVRSECPPGGREIGPGCVNHLGHGMGIGTGQLATATTRQRTGRSLCPWSIFGSFAARALVVCEDSIQENGVD